MSLPTLPPPPPPETPQPSTSILLHRLAVGRDVIAAAVARHPVDAACHQDTVAGILAADRMVVELNTADRGAGLLLATLLRMTYSANAILTETASVLAHLVG